MGKSWCSDEQRSLYRMQRALGDVEAARKGRLIKRVVRRRVVRSVWRLFR